MVLCNPLQRIPGFSLDIPGLSLEKYQIIQDYPGIYSGIPRSQDVYAVLGQDFLWITLDSWNLKIQTDPGIIQRIWNPDLSTEAGISGFPGFQGPWNPDFSRESGLLKTLRPLAAFGGIPDSLDSRDPGILTSPESLDFSRPCHWLHLEEFQTAWIPGTLES